MNQKQWIGVSAALVVVAIFLGYNYAPNIFNQLSSNNNMNQLANVGDESGAVPETGVQTISSPQGDMTFQDEMVGIGKEAVAGDTVTVNYTGTFTDGTKFDSSYDHGKPFTFTLGAGQVIAGWDLGVAGMKEGGKRKLMIPSALGYGPNDYGPIPGNSTLNFEVELVKVETLAQ